MTDYPVSNPSTQDDFRAVFAQKMPTGIEGLDHILDGGITRTNSLLIEGAPGTGKSTFGVQMLVRGAEQYGEPGVMGAAEEFPRQLYCEYDAYGFDLPGLEEKGLLRIIWTDPRKVVSGFTGKEDLVGRIIDEMGARRLLIDSITHFRRVAEEDIDLREVLYRVLNNLKLKGVNSILIKELERTDSETIAFEEYVVDASIRIGNDQPLASGENLRFLQVRKTRGQKHISGFHPFEFQSDGIHVYPHFRPIDVALGIPKRDGEEGRKKTGVAGLDHLIEGGFPSRSLNLVVGYSGTGTSTLARHFLHSRLSEGEKCLYLSFHDTLEEFIRNGQALGMDCSSWVEDKSLDFWTLSPLRLIPERFLYDLSQRVRHGEYSNMVWDAISNLRVSIQDEAVLRETQHLIALLLRRAGITAVLINESTEMCGLIRLTDLDFAELADSAIQLSFAEVDGRVHRFLGIMKMARTNHTKDLHEFQITSQGMRVLKKATGVSGILSGRAEGKLEAVAEHVLGPLLESSSALGNVIDFTDLSEETRGALIAAREKLGIADILLREHFGITDFASVVEEIKDR